MDLSKLALNRFAILALLLAIVGGSQFFNDAAAKDEPPAGLFQKALPLSHSNASALSYHEIAINTLDPRNKEPLVNLADYGIAGEAFYSARDGLNAPYHRCVCPEDSVLKSRKTVAEKLQKVNLRLACVGLELYVFDAYRPVSCQRELWDYFMSESKRMLGAAPPSRLVEYAGKFCSNPGGFDPGNYKTWPTHLTGGAVDLCLRRKETGELLYMGSIFDDASDLSITRHFEEPYNSQAAKQMKDGTAPSPEKDPSSGQKNMEPASAIEARQNRRLLYWSMQAEGFANYPNEWWHFDFGNQMWVQNRSPEAGCAEKQLPDRGSQSETAFYGAI